MQDALTRGYHSLHRMGRRPGHVLLAFLISLTAHAMAADKERALEAGCDDFDTKPVELARLLDKMDQLLKRSA